MKLGPFRICNACKYHLERQADFGGGFFCVHPLTKETNRGPRRIPTPIDVDFIRWCPLPNAPEEAPADA